MESNSIVLDPEARVTIERYLDAVEEVLLEQKITRSERSLILGELESQIHSMLSTRSETATSNQTEMVAGILETLDSPESYRRERQTDSPLASSIGPLDPIASEGKESETVQPEPTVEPSKKKEARFKVPNPFSNAREYWQRHRIDELAIASCAANALGLFLALATGLRAEAAILVSGLLLITGCGLGCYSIFRIKRSNGKLWGGIWAFAGTMVLPTLAINFLAITLAVRTPLWAVLLVAGVIYANYRLLKRIWKWLACQRMKHRPVRLTGSPVTFATGASAPMA